MKMPLLPGQILSKVREVWWQAAFMKAYLSLISDAKASSADKMEQAMLKLARPEDGQEFMELLRQSPVMRQMFEQRYLPPTYTVEQLKAYPVGSLGYAYYRHMRDNGLGVDYYTVPDPTDDLAYFRMRLVQTHDVWHTLLGFPTSFEGESGIVAFNLGHYYRHLGAAAPKAMVLLTIILSAGLFRHATRFTQSLPELFDTISRGWLLGQQVVCLIPGQWESMWEQPLEELRRQYNITPFSTVYDFEPEEASPASSQLGTPTLSK